MSERVPRTAAGLRMLGWLRVVDAGGLPPPIVTAVPAIVAIEDEATDALKEVARKLLAYAGHGSNCPLDSWESEGEVCDCGRDEVVAAALRVLGGLD